MRMQHFDPPGSNDLELDFEWPCRWHGTRPQAPMDTPEVGSRWARPDCLRHLVSSLHHRRRD